MMSTATQWLNYRARQALFVAICLLIFNINLSSAEELVAKGGFALDENYPTRGNGDSLLNFHVFLIDSEKKEGDVNFFVFHTKSGVFEFARELDKTVFQKLTPCNGFDRKRYPVVFDVGGFVEPIRNRRELERYGIQSRHLSSYEFVFIPVFSNLYRYGGARYGYEWLKDAVLESKLCVQFGVGKMFTAISSSKINITELAKFTFEPLELR